MKRLGGDRQILERGRGLAEVDLSEADEVNTGSEETVTDDVAAEGVRDGCFEGREGLFAEICSSEVGEG